MFNLILNLIVGIGVGVVCGFIYLPCPAPINFGGIVAILGIYLGYSTVKGVFQ
jgi:XapX domain-containing protein